MNDTTQSNQTRHWLPIFVYIALISSLSLLLFFFATYSHPPRWLELAIPIEGAAFGGLFWLTPGSPRWTPIWRRRTAIFFFALSALTLIKFLMKG